MRHQDVSPRTFKWSMTAILVGFIACSIGVHEASNRLRPAMLGVAVATEKFR